MRPVTIAHIFPDLLNLYGDGGNLVCLKQRCAWRGIPVEVIAQRYGESLDLSQVDIVFLGGGPDREQKLASEGLLRMRDALKEYVEAEGVLLAICGGYQILGKEWLLAGESIEGLGIVDIVTKRVNRKPRRLIENIVLQSPLCPMPVVGYENHAGRTFLGEGLKPFGKVISTTGWGNNDDDKQDGVLYKNVLGTYLHGPLLGKNPQIADHLLKQASSVRTQRGLEAFELSPLDDTIEKAANEAMLKRLNVARQNITTTEPS
ncbi:MAG: glutamine amidotransferase [Coriobacteriaceae bacterium]|jgi:CobQ-like glutamine amidotransferase family enzyme|nr:glutamine amidotransferase [Coriobacteriaceae bacterium]